MPASLRQALLALHTSTHAGAAEQHGQLTDSAAELQADLARAAASVSLERLRAPLESQEMFALPQTIVAMESLQLLAELLRSHLLPAAEDAAPAAAPRVRALVEQVGPITVQIYRGVARGMLDLEPIVAAIRNRSWAPREIGTQHSPYVDQLVQHVQQLAGSLSQLGVPVAAYRTLLGEAIGAICEHLVDGYAGVKKASDEGRAQMSLDVKTLQAALRKLLPEMAPSMAHVEDYLRALYLPPQELLAWARAHPQYSVRHRTALVALNGVSSGLKKREQQDLLDSLAKQDS